jgi:hypothetical protein
MNVGCVLVVLVLAACGSKEAAPGLTPGSFTVDGYKRGDAYQFPESALTNWAIRKPDGSEEGNVVGKFLDECQKQPH